MAQAGITGAAQPLPHAEAIQRSFERYDLNGVRAHVGGPAAQAADALGAEAFATGNDVAFRGSPDLHTAAHEAAHVIQQRGGVQLKDGVGQAGDAYEQHADAVADRVVSGESAKELLDQTAGGAPGTAVQLRPDREGAARAGARFLRDLAAARDVSLDAAIPTTIEYQHYLRPDLVWQWGAKVTAEEARLACKLIVEAMRDGRAVDWRMEARTFLNQARAQLGKAVAPEAAGPNESVAHDEGRVYAPQDQPEQCIREDEQVDKEREPDSDQQVVIHDPGFPDLNDLLDEARELAKDLEGQGEREDSFARELLRLVDENKKLIIGLGLLVGSYALGARFLGGRLVIQWGWNAVGAAFERRLARSLQLTPQLEEGLRRIEQVKTTLQELDSRGGAGINWKTKRERWSKRAVAQLDDMACGPACVKMVMEDHGLEPVAQEAIIQAVRGDGPLLTTSAEQLADFLNSVDPAGRWHGGAHRDTWPDESKNDVSTDMFNMARRFGNGGSWIAQASDLGTGAGHFVVVEGIAENGTVSVRDPWAWLANQRIKSPQTRQATGTIYRVEWKVFYAAWTGYAVWSGAKVR